MSSLSANAKSLITSSVVLLTLAGMSQGICSYLYQTPFAINAAIVEEKFNRLSLSTEQRFYSDYMAVRRFVKNPHEKLIAAPKVVDGKRTYTYSIVEKREVLNGPSIRITEGNNWNEYSLKEKMEQKKKWEQDSVLQDWEAVNQFVKDVKESQKKCS